MKRVVFQDNNASFVAIPVSFNSLCFPVVGWGGQAWVRREDSHSWASGTWHCLDGERIAGGGMAESHAMSDALKKVNQNQLTISKMQSVANSLKPHGLKLEAETDEDKNESKGKKLIVHKPSSSGFGIRQDKSLELAGFCPVWLFALGVKYW